MARNLIAWAMPGIIFSVSFAFAACSDAASSSSSNCAPTGAAATGAGGAGGEAATTSTGAGGTDPDGGEGGSSSSGGILPGGLTTGNEKNTFDHFNDPGASGQKDPFELLKERAEEGPPEIRTRLHSCTKISYTALGDFLTSRGVNLEATAGGGQPQTAGQLYKNGGDALGVARFETKEGETYFHTTAGATKLFDIFVQAAPEIIANIQAAPACQLNGQGKPMFNPADGTCVYESLSCLMGRPAKDDDLILCNLILKEASDPADLAIKQRIAVAAFLSAAHSCE